MVQKILGAEGCQPHLTVLPGHPDNQIQLEWDQETEQELHFSEQNLQRDREEVMVYCQPAPMDVLEDG
ncbi:hypothetical protein PtA15_3A67 [Puccinia triticina]|uniref:Uncharacterized protein n=1 Tax=Puccinia triticina TaxID=208348 RepID=A0ABY7CBW4_9BASI|nr:uncharacterized protein PtA15_3A67 [Puccinia triticina]WAQ82703.1 hypothetical protein PtA15_3A67 [Puccinia triticina]